MKNLHSINNLTDEIKLLITNWHIQVIGNPKRRIGKVQYLDDGTFRIWSTRYGNRNEYVASDHVKMDAMQRFLKLRRIPIEYFKEDMIYNA